MIEAVAEDRSCTAQVIHIRANPDRAGKLLFYFEFSFQIRTQSVEFLTYSCAFM